MAWGFRPAMTRLTRCYGSASPPSEEYALRSLAPVRRGLGLDGHIPRHRHDVLLTDDGDDENHHRRHLTAGSNQCQRTRPVNHERAAKKASGGLPQVNCRRVEREDDRSQRASHVEQPLLLRWREHPSNHSPARDERGENDNGGWTRQDGATEHPQRAEDDHHATQRERYN